jgi:Dolichyl-phosphate-mannose-protein mannosyltransferase
VALTTEHGGPRAAWVLIVCGLVLAPTLAFRMGVDQGVFAYMGAALLQGKWPYLQTWESDFPGLAFLQAGEIFVFGRSGVAFRFFDLLFQLGNAYLIFRMATRTGGRAAGLIAAVLFCLIYQGYGPWNTAQRDGFGLLFILAGFWLYFTAERRPPVRTAALIGLGLGVAFLIKPTLLALALFYAPLVTQLGSRRAVALAATAAAALMAPAAIVIVGYWAAGGLTQIYEACVAYQSVYTARLRGTAPSWTIWLQRAGHLGLNAWVLLVAYVPFLFWRHDRRARVMLWLGYAGSVYAVWVQGTFAGYHYLPGLAIGSILVGSMFSLMVGLMLNGMEIRVGRSRMSAATLAAVALMVAASFVYLRKAPIREFVSLRFLGPPVANEFRIDPVFDFTESYEVAAYLRQRTRPEDPIQIWGYESLVYYLAERDAASRFQMSHPLVMRIPGQQLTPMQQRWRAEFLSDMTRRPPAYIAVVRGDRWWWAPEERTSEELLNDFPEWKALIEQHYALDHTIGRYLVFRRVT